MSTDFSPHGQGAPGQPGAGEPGQSAAGDLGQPGAGDLEGSAHPHGAPDLESSADLANDVDPVGAQAQPGSAEPQAHPVTGDPEIDGVLEELAAAQDGSLADRIAAGERAQSALQSRLRDLGGA